MHPPGLRHEALALVATGLNDCEVARRLGLPRTRAGPALSPGERRADAGERRDQGLIKRYACSPCGCGGTVDTPSSGGGGLLPVEVRILSAALTASLFQGLAEVAAQIEAEDAASGEAEGESP